MKIEIETKEIVDRLLAHSAILKHTRPDFPPLTLLTEDEREPLAVITADSFLRLTAEGQDCKAECTVDRENKKLRVRYGEGKSYAPKRYEMQLKAAVIFATLSYLSQMRGAEKTASQFAQLAEDIWRSLYEKLVTGVKTGYFTKY